MLRKLQICQLGNLVPPEVKVTLFLLVETEAMIMSLLSELIDEARDTTVAEEAVALINSETGVDCRTPDNKIICPEMERTFDPPELVEMVILSPV